MEISHYWGRPTWAEVDLTVLANNIREFRRLLPGNVRLMAVLKADGYGHGAAEVASTALKEGASWLGVASLEEGVDLRQKGIKAPILILGYTDPRQNPLLLKMDLTPTLFSRQAARTLSAQACALGKRVAVHVKLDTGMGRLGLSKTQDVLELLQEVSTLPGIELEGVYTHLASADEKEKSFTSQQLGLFNNILKLCAEKGLAIPLKHAANSAATLAFPESYYDMVRVGLGLYGYYPSAEVKSAGLKLFPVMSLKSKVVFLKKISASTPISYGRTYLAARDTIIATVPLGYGDGYSRLLSGKGYMLVRGQKAPVAGRVCMDYTMLDVGLIPGVKEGDEVVACGSQEKAEINAEQIAGQLGTISYEILCSINSRVPRVYYRDGMVQKVKNVII